MSSEGIYKPQTTEGKYGPLVGSIDEGTSSARFLVSTLQCCFLIPQIFEFILCSLLNLPLKVFAARNAEALTYHQIEISQICPREGWVEQDPVEILNKTKECINQTVENLKQMDINPSDIVATGITNQRETTIVWDKVTGEPLYNAIGRLMH